MKCKKHLSDYSSAVGICASCLRDRLFYIIAAQAEAQAQGQVHLSRAFSRVDDDDQSRKSDAHPPPLIFPRSVPPYISHRKSDDDVWNLRSIRRDDYHRPQHDLLFFSTPQLGPTFKTTSTFVSSGSRRQKSRFSNWKTLFRFGSDKSESDPAVPSRNSCDIASTSSPSTSASASSSSPSWFSSIFSGHRKNKKKKSRFFSLEHSVVAFGGKPFRTVDRGMSPVEGAESYEYFDEHERSPTASGYSSDSSQKWRRSPAIAPGSVRRSRPGLNRSVSGFPFCLSPLVRASPNPQWNQKATPTDMSFSGEIRPQVKPHLYTASSFCANRSRKLADFGRANPNR